MPPLIERFIIGSLDEAMLPGGDDRRHALLLSLFKHGLAIIAPTSHQITGSDPFNQASGLGTLGLSALRDKDSERPSLGIHGEMDFSVEPPFVRFIA